MTLTEFLLARIAEDEAAARGHEGTAYHHWQYVAHRDKIGGYIPGQVADDWHDGAYVPVSEHIARHDPARVLAECEAKRRIVEESKPMVTFGGVESEWWYLRALAAVYSDHPDYRDEWSPAA